MENEKLSKENTIILIDTIIAKLHDQKYKANLVLLPNGESINPATVKTIRKGDPQEAKPNFQSKQVARVIIDFVLLEKSDLTGGHSNCIIIDCKTIEERDQMAKDIHRLLTK